tara:strand:+ start:89 stop:325 length:237 start_codon:yes stop_codon:yes gene_type:complete
MGIRSDKRIGIRELILFYKGIVSKNEKFGKISYMQIRLNQLIEQENKTTDKYYIAKKRSEYNRIYKQKNKLKNKKELI